MDPGKDAKFDSKESAFASMWDLISAAQAAWKKEISVIPVIHTDNWDLKRKGAEATPFFFIQYVYLIIFS